MLAWRRQLDITGTGLLDQGARLQSLASARLRAGEIDYFQYVQSLQAAFDNEMQYLSLVEQYNQAVLFFQFLSK